MREGLFGSVVLAAVLLCGCTGSGDEQTAETTTSTMPAPVATEPEPAVVLAVGEELALVAGQCWGPLPTPKPSTSVPASATVAVVDCAGTSAGIVYGNGCLAAEPPQAREPVVQTACPGRPDDPWPGLREIAPAAAAACLPLFEEGVGEKYATSSREAVELVPTEELWALGERRYVCTAPEPAELE